MNVPVVIVVGFVAGWIGFMVGVVFVCVVESSRERHRKSWQPPREREVSL